LSVVYYKVDVSATGRSFVQTNSTTEYNVYVCVCERERVCDQMKQIPSTPTIIGQKGGQTKKEDINKGKIYKNKYN